LHPASSAASSAAAAFGLVEFAFALAQKPDEFAHIPASTHGCA